MLRDSLNIALAHDHLFQIGGAEQVLLELSRIFPQAPIYTLICTKASAQYFPTTQIIPSFLQQIPYGISKFKWYLRLMPLAWEHFDFSGYDVVISSSSAFVKGLITTPHTIHICYCHTPTRYLWSDRIDYLKSTSVPKPLKLYLMSTLNHLRTWDQTAAGRPDYFLANSFFVAGRIQKYYGRTSTVIYPPVAIDDFRIDKHIDSYYLVVSRLRPYKRVDLIIEAFNHLRLPLIIIGTGEEYVHLKNIAKPNIRFLGEVSNKIRNKYIARCRAFIHPQVEDFGISAVEAMASGRPVIAFRGGGITESMEEGITGVFFDEQTWEALAYAILQYDYTTFDPVRIREHAQRFDVKIFRSKIISCIDEIVQTKYESRY